MGGRGGPRIGTLLAAGASRWEPAALETLSTQAKVTLVKRCLDLSDLLATAAAGTAQVAVVSDRLPGFDADSVDRLAREGVRTVAVTSAAPSPRGAEEPVQVRARLLRMGVAGVLDEDAVDTLPAHVLDAAELELRAGAVSEAAADIAEVPSAPVGPVDEEGGARGRLTAVWGPTGAPGRTTVAIGLAAELAARGQSAMVVDADPYGGAVAQHLAVLDEVSGLLAAARLANAGQLDSVRLAGLAREIGPRMRILTGLPRPDRWTEVRPAALNELLTTARTLDEHVVVDTGFGLPSAPVDPFAVGPTRDEITSTVLEEADQLVVVGSADPVGLTRLVRSLRDIGELRTQPPDVVVVNRMRTTLGWSTREIEDLMMQVASRSPLVFLPEDRIAVDRALVSGRTLLESGDSPLRRAMAELPGFLKSAVSS